MKINTQEILLRLYNDDPVTPSQCLELAIRLIERSTMIESYSSLDTIRNALSVIQDWEEEKELKIFEECTEQFKSLQRCPHSES